MRQDRSLSEPHPLRQIFCGLSLALGMHLSWASVSIPYLDGQLPIAPDALATYGPDLFGDKVNLYSGALEFEQTDLSLPGNNNLPVALTRRYTLGRVSNVRGQFGDWDLAVPRISGTFSKLGWLSNAGGTNRCSGYSAPPAFSEWGGVSFTAADYWQGTTLDVPGHGAQELLTRASNYLTKPTDGLSYPIVTRNNWQISCLQNIQNGSGEGFVAVSPDGVRYRFDWMAKRALADVRKGGTATERYETFLFATNVTDRFGKSVAYAYDPANPMQLQSITSSDGRVITLQYANAKVVSASDGTRSFNYSYTAQNDLRYVLQPDGSRWTFNLSGMLHPQYEDFGEGAKCDSPGVFAQNDVWGDITHPSGAVGRFNVPFRTHGKTYVQQACKYVQGTSGPTTGSVWPRLTRSQTLVEKTISGPGVATMTWLYSHSSDSGWAGCNCLGQKVVTVTNPDLSITRHTFGNRWRINEGQLLTLQEGWNGTTALRTSTYRYREPAGQRYPERFGDSPSVTGDWLAAGNRPQDKREIVQQVTSFNWEVLTTPLGFDALARPVQVSMFSTLGYARSETTGYSDNTGKWVMGQTASVTDGFNQVSRFVEYDAVTALPSATYKFGLLLARYIYNPDDGTLYQRLDPLGRATTRTDYKRGIPRLVVHRDGRQERAEVNNLGKLDWYTNEVGATTNYTYDSMARLVRIDYPSEPDRQYLPTLQYFDQVNADEHGLGPGHWRQITSTGNARTTRYYDALWRVRLEQRVDSADINNTSSMLEHRYNHAGKKTYQSYAQRSITPIDVSLTGTRWTYDGLQREVEMRQSSEMGDLVTTTTYQNNFQRRVTNPRGFVNEFTFKAFDQPAEDQVAGIWGPDSTWTAIYRDDYGQPLSIVKGGTYAGEAQQATRAYYYDGYRRLCKTIEPETGATVQSYDDAGNVAWRASGQALTNTGNCDQAAVAGGSKLSFGYDARDRLLSTSYGDGSQNIMRSYWPDGLLQSIETTGGGRHAIKWAYEYNSRRMLTLETYSWGDPNNRWTYAWKRDSYGHVEGLTDIMGYMHYAPNALGQPTQVSGFASDIAFHPNGALNRMTFANGIAHTVAQNARGLPQTWSDAGVTSDSYSYDGNGNVSSITDNLRLDGDTSRTMAYDGLDRLFQANGIWGAANYSYDALDNLRAHSVGPRSVLATLDAASNRLTQLNVNGQSIGLLYDANGNLAQRGAQAFRFDIGNRLMSATNKADYVYDGHGRRNLILYASGSHRHQAYMLDGKMRHSWRLGEGHLRHVYLGDKLIAEMTETGVKTFFHTDALGSPVARTDGSRNVLERTRYEPYGATAQGTNPTGFGFTGHVNDADTGLVYMQQRYYDPIAGRFLSVDPVTTDAKTGSSFNRYVYGNNNPYKFKDPDGRAAETPWDAANVAMGAVSLVRNVASGNYVGAAVDAVGIVIDVAATAAPGVPGGAATAIQAVRAADKVGDAAKVAIPKPGMGKGSVPPGDRDPKRLFTREEVAKGLEKQGGDCAGCGKKLDSSEAVGHHTQRHADGGKTTSENLTVVCNPCHKEVHKPD